MVDYPENGISAVATYTASGGESDGLAWTLTGADARLFSIDDDGVLRFRTPPDYEAPGDAGADNTYNLTVGASDGERGDDMAVVVRVTNVDEDGTVTLSPTKPSIGEPLTASLSDPDGAVSGVAWQWAASQDGVDWSPIAGATGDSYTPVDGDAGSFLRAQAFYTDGEGAGKTAMRATDEKLSTSETFAPTGSMGGAIGKGPGSTIPTPVPDPTLTQPEQPTVKSVPTPNSPQVASGAQEEGVLDEGSWPWLSLAILAAIAVLFLLFLLWRSTRGGRDDDQGAPISAA